MTRFNLQGNTREILDWFHLVEKLYKVGGSIKRVHEGKKLLWQGKVESAVKQIDRRLKISGAQWNSENVPQLLKHRCAYLNDTLLA
jgi:hypothetical protein